MGASEFDSEITLTPDQTYKVGDIIRIEGSNNKKYDGTFVVKAIRFNPLINRNSVAFDLTRSERRGKNKVEEKYYLKFAKKGLNHGR